MDGKTANWEVNRWHKRGLLVWGKRRFATKALTQESCNVGLAGGRREELSGGLWQPRRPWRTGQLWLVPVPRPTPGSRSSCSTSCSWWLGSSIINRNSAPRRPFLMRSWTLRSRCARQDQGRRGARMGGPQRARHESPEGSE